MFKARYENKLIFKIYSLKYITYVTCSETDLFNFSIEL